MSLEELVIVFITLTSVLIVCTVIGLVKIWFESKV